MDPLWLIPLLTLASALATRLAMAVGMIDTPNHRSSHTRPTPRSGGLAIAAVFLGAYVWWALAADPGRPPLTVAAFGGLAVYTVAFTIADDAFNLAARYKLLFQILGAAVFAGVLGRIESVTLPGLGAVALGPAAAPVTFLWLLFAYNALNFMDGLNGLVAGTAMIAAGALAILAAADPFVVTVAVLLIGATLGFFVFNYPWGRIFMGDAGSHLLAFVLAGLAVLAADGPARVPFPALLVILFPLWFDVLATLAVRARRGENLLRAHREHAYQLVQRMGVSHAGVSAGLFVQVAALAGLVIALGDAFALWAAPLLAALAVTYGAAAFAIRRRARRHGVIPPAP